MTLRQHFTCKDKSPKEALALQILGYSVLSLLGENLEEKPEVHIHTFKDSETPLQELVEAVEICPLVWELCCAAAPQSKDIFPALLEVDQATKTQEALDTVTTEILGALSEAVAPYQIIDELLDHGVLADDRIDALVALLTQKKPTDSATTPANKRSHTLRVKGRRALTPVRGHRHRKNQTAK